MSNEVNNASHNSNSILLTMILKILTQDNGQWIPDSTISNRNHCKQAMKGCLDGYVCQL